MNKTSFYPHALVFSFFLSTMEQKYKKLPTMFLLPVGVSIAAEISRKYPKEKMQSLTALADGNELTISSRKSSRKLKLSIDRGKRKDVKLQMNL